MKAGAAVAKETGRCNVLAQQDGRCRSVLARASVDMRGGG